MGIITDIFGGGDTKKVQQSVLTPEQRELVSKQVELAEFQLTELNRQRTAQKRIFRDAEGRAEDVEAAAAAGEARAGTAAETEDELAALQLESIRAGGQATEQEIDLINQAIERSLAAGELDIERFQSQSTEQLREELAPQLGLRPGDTPILDRGARIAAEAGRQQGTLVNRLRGQQAEQLLNFPLQRAGVLGGLNLAQQSLAQNIQQFQNQLRQSAFANRLALAGTRTTAGLGLAGAATPNVGAALANTGTTQTTESGAGFGQIAGGVGGILQGLGAVGVSFGSSRALKTTEGPVDEDRVLEALATLPVEIWSYIGEDDRHIGTFAEDFQAAFGVGDGKTISVIDAVGVVMASLKALSRRLASEETVAAA